MSLSGLGTWLIQIADDTEVTLASDTATITQTYHTIAAQSSTSDDLATIALGTGITTVSSIATYRPFVVLQAASGDTITVKHGTDNISLNGESDFALSGDKHLMLFYNGTAWTDIGAGGGSGGITQLVTQHFDANGSANFTSNSTSYVDVDASLEFSITTSGGDLYVEYVALADKNTAGTATFRVVLDNGSDIVPDADVTGAAEVLVRVPGVYSTAVAIRAKFTSLAADTYTVKMQYKSSDANDARLYNNTHPVTAKAMEF